MVGNNINTQYITYRLLFDSTLKHSHYPYPSDGEGSQADRQYDPGSHWSDSEAAGLSQA